MIRTSLTSLSLALLLLELNLEGNDRVVPLY